MRFTFLPECQQVVHDLSGGAVVLGCNKAGQHQRIDGCHLHRGALAVLGGTNKLGLQLLEQTAGANKATVDNEGHPL